MAPYKVIRQRLIERDAKDGVLRQGWGLTSQSVG
jgi:hypothetical protein